MAVRVRVTHVLAFRSVMLACACVSRRVAQVCVSWLRVLAKVVKFLKASKAWRGRAIIRPKLSSKDNSWKRVLAIGLKHGDCLQVDGKVSDPMVIEHEPSFALGDVDLVFWRRHKESPLRFHSWWAMIPGFYFPSSIKIDSLHTADLGYMPSS